MWLFLEPKHADVLDQMAALLTQHNYEFEYRVQVSFEPDEPDTRNSYFKNVGYYVKRTSVGQASLLALLLGDKCEIYEIETIEGTLTLSEAIAYFWNDAGLVEWNKIDWNQVEDSDLMDYDDAAEDPSDDE